MATAASLAETLDRLAAGRVADRTRLDAPLGPLTTYRVGGPAAALVRVDDDEDLDEVAAVISATGAPCLVIGRGSNLLVADRGFAGVAVVLGDAFAAVAVGGTTVRAGGAAKLPVVARTTVQHGLTGFEWAVGVPGSIGGAVCMNAGGHGSEMADTLVSAEVVDLTRGERRIVPAEALDLRYRHSAIGAGDLVVAATVGLARGDEERSRSELAEIVQWRRANQPGGQNAGSVFTNPDDDSAGRLIDSAGAKGLRVGTAEVSPKHANFIQSDEGGSADDVFALMGEVRRRVREAHGIELHAETRLVGFDDTDFDETGSEADRAGEPGEDRP